MLDLKKSVLRKVGLAVAIATLTAAAFGGVALAADRSPASGPEPTAPASEEPDDDDDAREDSSTKDAFCDDKDDEASEYDDDNVEDHDDEDEDE